MARILIAEDDAEMRQLLATLLDQHDLVFACDGNEALALLDDDQLHLDLALLDWMMPGVDGPAVTEQIRAPESSRRDLPVVMMTARSGSEARHRSYRAGADSFLAKPFADHDLATIVDLHLLQPV